ncbi:MAG: ATP-binding cassette domain-containing protein [Clostridiales Family XIII bacterium]|jgi:peptide/nickel transport system ATP-binding protein|nr:ATP-binding cassette domain-containing protein [Clostridiales Family XIII bacterium]
MHNNHIVEAKELCKYFKTPHGQLHAVDGLSFQIAEHTVLGVVGESGCGKSTLGRMLAGLHEVTSGSLYFEGQDVTNPSRKAKKSLYRRRQMIFQDPSSSLDPRQCVSDLIAEPMNVMKLYKGRRERDARVEELMDIVGLAKRYAFSYPHELDGGRRQRIGIARALACDPKFIVCDEPVSALDVSIQAQILNLLQDLQYEKGLTYMFITHDLSVVKHISDEILVMYLGCEMEHATSIELFEKPLHPYTKGLLSAIPIPSIHTNREEFIMSGEVASPINPNSGCRFASRCIFADEPCYSESPEVIEVLPRHFCACHFAREVNGM